MISRERIEELAVSYSMGELEGQSLADFKAWRSIATAEELEWFAAIVDQAGNFVMKQMIPVAPPPELKATIFSKLGLGLDAGGAAVEESDPDPDFSFLTQAQEEGEWIDLPVRGARMRPLSDHESDGHTIFLLELDPGARFPAHVHKGAESAFVLSGDLEIEGRFLRAGDFSRAAPGTRHRRLYSRDGCRALIVTSYENFHKN